MADKIESIPEARLLLASLRSVGYNEETAIADIVDNSVSAQARNIVLRFPIDPSDCCVAVCDDGIGMNKKELLDAMKSYLDAAHAAQCEDRALEELSEELFEQHLYTAGIPDPDLLIRTSGEMRVSNFLLWQIAYSEFVCTEVLWPDFNRYEFLRALLEFQGRDRRFGAVK